MEARIPVQAALFLLAAFAAAPHQDPEEIAPGSGAPAAKVAAALPAIFDPTAEAAQDIEAALRRAQRENRRVLILWGADWCPWSRGLHELLSRNKQLRKETASEYEVVRIDVGRFDRNRDLLRSYGHELTRASIPILTILDDEGNLLASEDARPLESRGGRRMGYDPARVLEFLVRYQGPPVLADEIFAKALAAAAAGKKRVLVTFSAPLRPACDKLETWLGSPTVAPVLAKDFVPVAIEVERMTGGAALMRRLRETDQASVPWFAILDAEGRRVATSDAGGCRNIRFPETPEDIEHFGWMLEKGSLRIWKADIEGLKSSLREARAKEEAERRRAKRAGEAKGRDADTESSG